MGLKEPPINLISNFQFLTSNCQPMPSIDLLIREWKKVPHRNFCGIFISGTDTGIGKTQVTLDLIKKFNQAGIPTVGFKPLCCGDRDDARKYWLLTKKQIPLDVINPIHLPMPVAPISQKCPAWPSMLKQIKKSIHLLHNQYHRRLILVEGAGGILCPISRSQTMRDLVKALGYPVLLVAPNKLGVLNQTLLSLEAIRKAKIPCKGVVLNQYKRSKSDSSRQSNLKILKSLIREPLYSLEFR